MPPEASLHLSSGAQQSHLVWGEEEARSASPTKDRLAENNSVMYDQSDFSKKENIMYLACLAKRQNL